jgi:hypothetical protein
VLLLVTDAWGACRVLALAGVGGAALAAIVTVGGIWAVAVGVMRIVLAFQVKEPPNRLGEVGFSLLASRRRTAPAVRCNTGWRSILSAGA